MAEGKTRARRARRHLRWPARLFAVLLVAVVVFAAGLVALGLSGRAIPGPRWVVAAVEDRANLGLGGRASVRIGAIEAVVGDGYVPRVRLTDVELLSPGGRRLALVENVGASFWPRPLLDGIVQARALSLDGADVALTRNADGSFDIALPEAGQVTGAALSPAQILDEIDRAFGLPALRAIETVDVSRIDLRFRDDRAGQAWTVSDGRMALRRKEARLGYEVNFGLAGVGGKPARVELSFSTERASSEAGVIARVTGVRARDLAAQSPALSWLAAIDAPISGALRTGIDRNGTVQVMQAELDIGAGALKPRSDIAAVPFDGVRVAMAYDPARARLEFSDIALQSPALSANARARAWLKGSEGGLPEALVVQLSLDRVAGNPEGIFDLPVEFRDGRMDFKLELDPFSVTLGQLTLFDQGRRVTARGRAEALPEGWRLALDAEADGADPRRVIELWPLGLAAKTRKWLSENVQAGEIFNVQGAARFAPGVKPRLSLGFEFRDGRVRFLRHMPPIQGGAGRATIADNVFTAVLDKGWIAAPQGGRVDVAGSAMRVPNIRVKPATGVFDLRTESSIPAALSMIDLPPLRLMQKARRGTDLAQGHASVAARVQLPLVKGVKPPSVTYEVGATLSGVRSDKVVPGRVLLADALTLTANRQAVAIGGRGTLSDVPFDATWHMSPDPRNTGVSHVAGVIDLSAETLSAFGVDLPRGSVTGRAQGEIVLDIRRGQPTRYRVTSGLAGAALAIPALGWSKPADVQGELDIAGLLGRPATVEAFRLGAPGFLAEGTMDLTPEGRLDIARLDRVEVGDWFEGRVELRGRGKGAPPAVAITAGTADFARADLGQGTGADGASGPVTVALDRVQISAGLWLDRFRGEFTDQGGLGGPFGGLVNGEVPITGTMAPRDGRSAFQIRAEDAGAALRAAGIFSKGRGGSLQLDLAPSGGRGSYTGRLEARSLRVVDAPVLAGLLDAVSVVGLIDQLNGPGILFNRVSGDFRLIPGAVEIRNGAATGASMGISAAGVYRTETREIDLQGTISPIYLLNGIGRLVSKKGEGLFGFNYTMKGSTQAPRIRVNPLSILTPGMFREIFRSAPPSMEDPLSEPQE